MESRLTKFSRHFTFVFNLSIRAHNFFSHSRTPKKNVSSPDVVMLRMPLRPSAHPRDGELRSCEQRAVDIFANRCHIQPLVVVRPRRPCVVGRLRHGGRDRLVGVHTLLGVSECSERKGGRRRLFSGGGDVPCLGAVSSPRIDEPLAPSSRSSLDASACSRS